VINSDGWRGYNGLVDFGYKRHFRVHHGKNEFAPEQIMGRLELDKKIKISTETAYRFVLQDKAVGGALYKYLRHQHKKYRKRYVVQDIAYSYAQQEWQSHLCVLYQ
jgi:IS30 family transposase